MVHSHLKHKMYRQNCIAICLYLVPVEDRQFEPRTLALRKLILTVQIPLLSQSLYKLRLSLQQGIVDGVAAGPCAVAPDLGRLQAQQCHQI